MLAQLALLARGARQISADTFLEYSLHEAAAVQAGFAAVAPHLVAYANQFQAFQDHILGCIGVALDQRDWGVQGAQAVQAKSFTGVRRTEEAAATGGTKQGEEKAASRHGRVIYLKFLWL